MKKALNLLLALVLMVTAVFTAVPAFADNGNDDYITDELVVWKTLRTNDGTNFAGETFHFALHRIALPAEYDNSTPPERVFPGTGLTDEHAITGMFAANPPVPTSTAPFVPAPPTVGLNNDGTLNIPTNGQINDWRVLGSATIDPGTPNLDYPLPAGGVYAEGSSDDLLADLVWTHAGIYAFRLREVLPTTNPRVIGEAGDAIIETTLFDASEYEVHVQVGIDADGDFYVQGVAVFRVVNGVRQGKVDPGRDVDGDNFGVNFTNNFMRVVDNTPGECVDPDDPDCPPIICPPGDEECPDFPNHRGLRVTKEVSGPGSSNTHEFDFTGRLFMPSVFIGELPTNFVAEVWTDGTPASGADAAVPPAFVRNVTFTPVFDGEDLLYFEADFELTGAQHLRLPGLPVGAGFEFAETGRLHYTVTHIDVWRRAAGETTNSWAPRQTFGQDATAPFWTPRDASRHLVSDDATLTAFLNVLDAPPITGIITNNMPIILAGAVVLGFVGIAAANKKRRSYE